MNVLLVNHRLDAAGGGTARKAVTLARALRGIGWQVRLAAFAFGPAVEPDVDAHASYLPHAMQRWTIPTRWPSTVFEQAAWADVVVLVNHWTTINAMYAVAAWRHHTPVVVMPCGALPIFGRSAWIKRAYNAAIGRRIVGRAQAGIAVTALEARDFDAYGLPRERVHVIPNAVAVDEASAADGQRFRQRWRQQRPFVLFAGRLAAIKGPDLLLRAWERIAPTTSLDLILAGDSGDLAGDVERWLATHGVRTRARWIGPLDHASLLDAFSAAHALVVPSRFEAMSLVLLEAALAGCPVIATTTCGVPDVAAQGGLEVEPTEKALASALAHAVAWPPGEAADRGARLRAWVHGTYTWVAITPRYREVLSQAAAQRR